MKKTILIIAGFAAILFAFGYDQVVFGDKANSQEIKAQNKMNISSVPSKLPIEGRMPALDGAKKWFNSKPLNNKDLRGKVVLVEFWTFSCYNCLNVLPYVKEWSAKYAPQGLVVIGVHSPEFEREANPENVRNSINELGISFPVAMDNDFAIWKRFNNHYWPAFYLIDKTGNIRYHHFGEGAYQKSEAAIKALLNE